MEPCKIRTDQFDGTAICCEACGHTALLHPGRHNTRLASCALCLLERLYDDGR